MIKIRFISGFLLLLLAFAPLGSCTIKTERSGTGVSFGLQTEKDAVLKENEELHLSEVRVIEFDVDNEKTSQSIAFIVLIVISIFGVGIKYILLKPFVWFAVLLSFLSWGFNSVAALMAQNTTIYGYLFMLIGIVFYLLTLNAVLPKSMRVSIT